MEPKKSENLYSIRYTINKKDIPAFVNELRVIQETMIEAVVESKASQGFPEATAVIDYIRSLK
jgi:hypothetical protein